MIGCEYASIFVGLGCKVDLINTQKQLLSYLDDEIADALSYYLRELGVLVRNQEEYERVETLDDCVILHLKSGKKISREVADAVAAGMKSWAMSKGVNSYTHWFQPLTGLTAEKHDMFFTPKGDGAIEVFGGDALTQQEPDASSFPSGGIRATFEARGYTAWDPSSPAFIMEIGEGKTLCIPTIFISYTGETLDYKTPLMKSTAFLEQAALPIVHMFDKEVSRVTATLGWEQEYFVIDEALYYSRPDLMFTGRTLIGDSPAKGQQLEDHYFGSIPERVYAFMQDFEQESYKLGIPLRTRHNEVAPAQFECAPIFEEVNIAVDHNTLLMDLMTKVAKRHKVKVLLHEKPFAGVNGSGKHNNWSMATDDGENLLEPGATPEKNLQFLVFLLATLKGVFKHQGALRAAIAVVGDREWRDGVPSEPRRFTTLPLTFERAFGGPGYARNPVGRGYLIEATRDAVTRRPADRTRSRATCRPRPAVGRPTA